MDPFEREEREKFLEAEQQAAWVRFVFAAFGVLYLWAHRADPLIHLGVGGVTLGVIWAYTLSILLLQPHRRANPRKFRYLTTGLDALFSTGWIAATGGWESTWWPLYLAMTVATAFRFDYRETVGAGVVFSLLYVAMLAVTGTFPSQQVDELSLRILFVLIVSVLSGPLSRRAFHHAVVRAAAEEEARQARRVEALKDELIANVSHELRTPLALILGPADELRRDESATDQQRRHASLILQNARTLLGHVNNLLETSRLEAGQVELTYRRVDVAKLLAAAAANFELEARTRGIDLVVEPHAGVEADVDREKLRQVLMNLLGNAFQFTPDGGIVRCAVEADVSHVTIEIADSGPGVAPKNRERVFERFQRFEPGQGRRLAGGTGLGLALAKSFVELHRGTIGVMDAHEGGALFRVELPRTAPHSAELAAEAEEVADVAEAPPIPAPEAPPPTDVDEARPLVLVVEDNADMNRFVREVLGHTYRTEAAYDGSEGLEKALRLRPDLILTDVMMPGMSGDRLVEEVRRHPDLDDVPIIVVTARAGDDFRVELLRSGTQDYLTKPFLPDELRARVDNLVTMKRVRDLLRAEVAASMDSTEALATEVVRRKRDLANALETTRLALDHAERANRLKSDFLSAVSHELRTPLASLSLIASRLQLHEHELPDDARSLVERLSRQNARLQTLIEGLLEYAKVRASQLAADVAPFNVSSVIGECIEDLREQASEKGLELDARISPGIGPFMGDARIFRLIILSLLGNAVKFTDKGFVRVDVRRTPDELVVTVADTGRGIPADDLVRIFEPFEQVQSEERRGGLGLGLSLVRELVVHLGGRISVHSEVGSGSRFTVRFPGTPPTQVGAAELALDAPSSGA